MVILIHFFIFNLSNVTFFANKFMIDAMLIHFWLPQRS